MSTTAVNAKTLRTNLGLAERVGPGDRALALDTVPGESGDASSLEPCRPQPLAKTLPWLEGRAGSRVSVTPEPSLVFPRGHVSSRSASMLELHAQMRSVLVGDLPVLLLGETGVGKDLLAHVLHLSSDRRGRPFVPVNCAAIPADLLEAEMFGIARGVATGVGERRGKFQLAEGGTLFLDEIGEMPFALQAKLLRALQGSEVQPVGGVSAAVDVRVVAATNSDLDRRIRDGRFRPDLYYRIAGIVLRVPPLRERGEDLPALLRGFLSAFVRETGRSIRSISAEAWRALLAYSWPGNVRELQHEMRRLAYLCPDGGSIELGMLSEHVLHAPAGEATAGGHSLDLQTNIAALERRLVEAALIRAGGKRAAAARLLGVSRNGLAMKIERLGIGNGRCPGPAPAGHP